jgi:lathosterol oxidase
MSEFNWLPLQVFGVYLAFASLWFFAGVAVLWSVLYRHGPGNLHTRKVFSEMPSRPQVLRELKYSCLTLVIISLGWLAVWTIDRLRWGQFYWDIREHSLIWLVGSVLITIVLWDAWFYWTHRMMHSQLLFSTFHRTHHRSRVTNPLTGYSIDVPEAITYVIFLPLVTMLVPLHPISMSIFMFIQLVGNLAIHQGHEFMPARFANSNWSYWLSSPTSHAMHHYHFTGNYGFFFQFWDRLMGTCHPDYDEELHRQCTRPESATNSDSASQTALSK